MPMLSLMLAAALGATMPVAGQDAAKPAAAATALSVEMPIADIAADARGKAVLDANFPGLTSHEMFDMFKGMTLKQLQPMSEGKISDEALAKTTTELAAIK